MKLNTHTQMNTCKNGKIRIRAVFSINVNMLVVIIV